MRLRGFTNIPKSEKKKKKEIPLLPSCSQPPLFSLKRSQNYPGTLPLPSNSQRHGAWGPSLTLSHTWDQVSNGENKACVCLWFRKPGPIHGLGGFARSPPPSPTCCRHPGCLLGPTGVTIRTGNTQKESLFGRTQGPLLLKTCQWENNKPTIFQKIIWPGSERDLEYGLYRKCPSWKCLYFQENSL